jgi:hypothetical protein
MKYEHALSDALDPARTCGMVGDYLGYFVRDERQVGFWQ